jgi:hypothetical protein
MYHLMMIEGPLLYSACTGAPGGGAFTERAEVGRHRFVQSTTLPWMERSDFMPLNHLRACAALNHVRPSSTIVYGKENRYVPISH